MLRVRLFRVLLPGLLLLLGGIVAWNLKPRGTVHTSATAIPSSPEAQVLQFKEWVGERRTVAGKADRIQGEADGRLELEGIRNLEITRASGGTIVVSADKGESDGSEGERVWHFEQQVVFFDPDSRLRLTLPVLEVDEVSGEARSEGDIRFSAPGMNGRVDALMYGLRGQPGRLEAPVLDGRDGGRLTADSAALLDGFRDIELIGAVRAEQPEGWLEADRMRVRRDRQDRLRRVNGRGAVRGDWTLAPTVSGQLASQELDVDWDEQGRVERARLNREAVVRRERDSLLAPTIEAVLREDGAGWHVEAFDDAVVEGQFPMGPGRLRAGRLEAELDAAARLSSAKAWGQVAFDGNDTRAEAQRAEYEVTVEGGSIRLFGEGRRKARLANRQTRVAADRIVSDPRGTNLKASGSVEATLLPASEAADVRGPGVFAADDAVHFVSTELVSRSAGSRLAFSGGVRGWQGERNLAASRVELTQQPATLHAEGQVSTRFPRQPTGPAVDESDYVLIESERLDYDERGGLAVYDGNVRMRFAEGWLEASRLEVQLDAETGEIAAAQAYDGVTLEVQAASDGEMPEPVSGRADRLVYLPAEASLRLIGEKTPAEVSRVGQGATTMGRVLLYRLDEGTYEVDAGAHGPATIRTPSG